MFRIKGLGILGNTHKMWLKKSIPADPIETETGNTGSLGGDHSAFRFLLEAAQSTFKKN